MLVVGRKNGKSTLAAAIGLYMHNVQMENQVVKCMQCATKKDQLRLYG